MENFKQQIEKMIEVCNLHAKSYRGGKEIDYKVQKAMRTIPRHNLFHIFLMKIDQYQLAINKLFHNHSL